DHRLLPGQPANRGSPRRRRQRSTTRLIAIIPPPRVVSATVTSVRRGIAYVPRSPRRVHPSRRACKAAARVASAVRASAGKNDSIERSAAVTSNAVPQLVLVLIDQSTPHSARP